MNVLDSLLKFLTDPKREMVKDAPDGLRAKGPKNRSLPVEEGQNAPMPPGIPQQALFPPRRRLAQFRNRLRTGDAPKVGGRRLKSRKRGRGR